MNITIIRAKNAQKRRKTLYIWPYFVQPRPYISRYFVQPSLICAIYTKINKATK